MNPHAPAPQLSLKILLGIALVGVLYVGRSVLAPITLAAMLGFVMAPVVRQIRRLGLGQGSAAIGALVVVGVLVAGIALVIFAQLGEMSRDLPRYESHLREKAYTLRELTIGRLQDMQGRVGKIVGNLVPAAPTTPASDTHWASIDRPPSTTGAENPSPAVLGPFLSALWGSLGTLGVVVLVLVFALLEQDSLRDRLIRLTGGRDVRAATTAFNDAAQRLSRYFISQFSLNAAVGGVIWGLLALLGVPYALVWAVLAGLLRFIPYVGFPAAALCAGLMAAAMVPGWDLVVSTLLVFLVVEVVSAYVVEPLLYGHSTGLSPFSVVVAAVFWGALWGPVGLLLSTPLTLCLVVAGRHVPALAFFDVLFGDAPALDLSQRFYQRSLSGDVVEILADAQRFLKRRSLAAYCDKVVMPAFQMGRDDHARGLISSEQQLAAYNVVSQFFAELMHMPRPKRVRTAVLDDNDLGLSLRQARQQVDGHWQGPLKVAPGSVLLCVSMADEDARLITELLVRVLRSEHWDARHVTVQELADPPADVQVDGVGSVFVVGARHAPVVDAHVQLLNAALVEVPQARVVLMQPWPDEQPSATLAIAPERMHHTVCSFEEAVALVRQGMQVL